MWIAGSVLFVVGAIGFGIQLASLGTPTPMATLPEGAYTGHPYTVPSFAWRPAPLYLFLTLALVGLALVISAVVIRFTANRESTQ
jgi:hypothetical protein